MSREQPEVRPRLDVAGDEIYRSHLAAENFEISLQDGASGARKPEKIELEIDVNGYIGDPKFRFFSAFTRAFRKSLTQKAKAVLNEIKKGTTMVATEAPSHVRDGVGQIGNLLNNTFSNLNPLAVLGETQRKKDEK